MSRVTTLNCDRCGAGISQINTKDSSAKINLWCPGDYRGSGGQRIDLCPECYSKFITFLESESETE